LASDRFWNDCARHTSAVIRYCESRPWADRIIGYANFLRVEGTHEPLIDHWLYDHGPRMTARWQAYLRTKYQTEEKLRGAYGDASLSFDSAPVPVDKLRGRTPDVSALLYWQSAQDNQPLRDYLALCSDLLYEGFTCIAAAAHGAAGHRRILLY